MEAARQGCRTRDQFGSRSFIHYERVQNTIRRPSTIGYSEPFGFECRCGVANPLAIKSPAAQYAPISGLLIS